MVSTLSAPAVVIRSATSFLGDRIAGACFTVLTSVSEVRNNRGDTTSRSAAHCVDHNQQFDKVIVDGRRGGLQHEHVAAADGLADLNAGFAVRELADLNHTERHV